MLPLAIYAENRAVIDAYLDQLIEALDAYRPRRRYRARFDQAALHYRAAKILVHRQTDEAEIDAALREIALGNRCLAGAACSPGSLTRRMQDDWRKSRVRR